MKKLFITLLVVGVASFAGYALLSGEHNSADDIASNTTQDTVLHGERVPTTIPPFKGHRLQTLIDFSNVLNDILFNRELTAERRAELLVAKGAPQRLIKGCGYSLTETHSYRILVAVAIISVIIE